MEVPDRIVDDLLVILKSLQPVQPRPMMVVDDDLYQAEIAVAKLHRCVVALEMSLRRLQEKTR